MTGQIGMLFLSHLDRPRQQTRDGDKSTRCVGQDIALLSRARGDVVNNTPHTSHFSWCFTPYDTHMRGSSRKFGVRTSHSMSHLHALMLCV